MATIIRLKFLCNNIMEFENTLTEIQNAVANLRISNDLSSEDSADRLDDLDWDQCGIGDALTEVEIL